MNPEHHAMLRWLEEHRDEILDAWRALVPGRLTQAALGSANPDPFVNPAGHRLHHSTAALLDGIVAGQPEQALAEAIEPLMRVRAIQGERASDAVGFVLLLARACAALGMPGEQAAALRDRLESVLLVAFDVYTRCREEISEIRVREARRRVATLLGRLGAPDGELGGEWGPGPPAAR